MEFDSNRKRAGLKPRREPYWTRLRTGCHLGYRVLAQGQGTWIARYRAAGGGHKTKSFGSIAPEGKRDPCDIAVKLALAWFDEEERGISGRGVTVADACRAYVTSLRNSRPKTAADAEGRFRRLVYTKPLGALKLERLRASDVRTWRDAQVSGDDDEAIRRSKDSANRNLNALRAALNLAYENQQVASDAAWRGVKAFDKVAARRSDCLTPAECRRLVKACDPDMALFVRAALMTGARPGELASLKVGDLRGDELTLRGKTGQRKIQVSTPARALFVAAAGKRAKDAPLLARADGAAWDRFYWRDKFRDAVARAKLPPDVVLYTCRHTAITRMLTTGKMDPLTVARVTGTSVAMIDRHYGHLLQKRAAKAMRVLAV